MAKKKVKTELTAPAYQAATHAFVAFPERMALEYLTLGLASEAGEVAGKAKKLIRGDYVIQYATLDPETNEPSNIAQVDLDKFHEDFHAEIGDCLWYISELCNLTGTSFEKLFAQNINKLAARKAVNTLKGSGDAR